jgi:hypothetical protein
MCRVSWVNLHPTAWALWVLPLPWYRYIVQGVQVTKMLLHHPPTCQLPCAEGGRAFELAMPLRCCVHNALMPIKELFCHHLSLLDLMEICKVVAMRAPPHVFHALSAGNDVGVPLGGRRVPSAHLPV